MSYYFNSRLQLCPFMRIAIFLMIGIYISDALQGIVGVYEWQCLYVLLVVAMAFMLRFARKAPILQTVVLFAMVVAGGAWRASYFSNDMKVELSNQIENYEAIVASSVKEKEKTVGCELIVTKGRLAGRRVMAYVQKSKESLSLTEGDMISADSRFERPLWGDDKKSLSYGTGHFDYDRWLKVHNVVARTYIPSYCWNREALKTDGLTVMQRLTLKIKQLRIAIMQQFSNSNLSDGSLALVAAMTLGDKSRLTDALRDTYSISGTSHVLALSGLHLGIIYTLLAMLLLPKAFRPLRMLVGNTLLLCVIWWYTIMVGMTPGIVRSAVMFTIFLMVGIMGREHMSLNALGISAVAILLSNPMSLWDVSFQMSFLSVFGILMGNERFYYMPPNKFLVHHHWLNCAWSLAKVSFAAQIMVAPLSVYYFGRFSCCFLLSNFVAIPLSTMIIYLSIAFVVSLPIPWLSSVLSVCLHHVATTLNTILAWIASFPMASIDNISIGQVQVVLAYIMICLLYCMTFYFEKMYRIARGYTIGYYEQRH